MRELHGGAPAAIVRQPTRPPRAPDTTPVPHHPIPILVVPVPTERSTVLKRKDVGKSIVYCERYFVGSEPRFYIEACGPDYRIWKRVIADEARALEIYTSYRFWVWFIEAFDLPVATRFITWFMHKLI